LRRAQLDHRHRVRLSESGAQGAPRASARRHRWQAHLGHTSLDSLSGLDIESKDGYLFSRGRNVEGPLGSPGAALHRA
jgi:hypothetical protein